MRIVAHCRLTYPHVNISEISTLHRVMLLTGGHDYQLILSVVS
jgi:hypothetical protein